MNPNSKKNRQLIRQYPFLRAVLKQPMLPNPDPMDARSVDNLTIRVEIADEQLMLRQADIVGLGRDSYLYNGHGSQRCVGKQAEYLFAITQGKRIIRRLDWPLPGDDVVASKAPVYGWHVLLKPDAEVPGVTRLLDNEVSHLVWVKVNTWYRDTGNTSWPGSRFGQFQSRDLEITVYGPPKCGFAALRERSMSWTHLHISNPLIANGLSRKDPIITQIAGCVVELCSLFVDEVWNNGLGEMCRDSGGRLAGRLEQTTVRVHPVDNQTWCFVLESDAGTRVEFWIPDDKGSINVRSQNGTLPELRQLVRSAVFTWREKPKSRAKILPVGLRPA